MKTHSRRSKPLTQADLLAGFPFIMVVPRYSMLANDSTGSIQEPNSYGVNSYWWKIGVSNPKGMQARAKRGHIRLES